MNVIDLPLKSRRVDSRLAVNLLSPRLRAAAQGYIDIAERVMNGLLEPGEARLATRAIDAALARPQLATAHDHGALCGTTPRCLHGPSRRPRYVVLIMLAFQFACTYRAKACCGVKVGAITGYPMGIAEPPAVILLYRAILTLHAVPDPDLRYFVDAASSWPEYPRRYLDAYNPDEEIAIDWQPTPHDVTVYLGVLTWARELTKRQWNIMVLRARDYSLSLIADMLRSAIGDIVDDHADAMRIVASAASRDRNIGCPSLDRSPQNAAGSRPHHCAQKHGGVLLSTVLARKTDGFQRFVRR